MASLSTTFLAALQSDQIAALSATQLAALTQEQVAALPEAFVNGLSTQQLQTLSPEQLSAFNSSQINALTNTQIFSLRSVQVNSLDPTEVQNSIALVAGGGSGTPGSNSNSLPVIATVWAYANSTTIKKISTLVTSATFAPGHNWQEIVNVLNGTDLQVQLEAHWVIQGSTNTRYLHTWLNVSSYDANGHYHSYTLSFEPSNLSNPIYSKLIVEFDADYQDGNPGPPPSDQNVLEPWTIPPPKGASGQPLTEQQFATLLTNFCIRYNGSEIYSVPQIGAKPIYNSNSGISSILTFAGVDITNAQVTFNSNPLNSWTVQTQVGTFPVSLAETSIYLGAEDPYGVLAPLPYAYAPGWGNILPKQKDFHSFGGLTTAYEQITTNPVAALLNSPYLRGLILSYSGLGAAFSGDLTKLNQLVSGIEAIRRGACSICYRGDLILHRLPSIWEFFRAK